MPIGAMSIGRQLREQLVGALNEKGSPERETVLNLGFEVFKRLLTDPETREALVAFALEAQAPTKKAPTGQADVAKLPRARNAAGQLVPNVEPEAVVAGQG